MKKSILVIPITGSNADDPIHCMATWKNEIEWDVRLDDMLTECEKEAVLWHEKTHIRQHHIHIRMAASWIISIIFWRFVWKHQWKKAGILWPLNILIMMVMSWTSEFLADNGAYREGYGEFLISALKRISNFNGVPQDVPCMTHPSNAMRSAILNRK